MPLRNLVIILVVAFVSLVCYQRAERSRYSSVIGDAMQLVDDYYLEPVDRRGLFEDAMNGMLERLDPYSAYISPESYREMETTLDQEFGGIGVEVQKPEEAGPLVVHNTIVGTPAFRAKIKPGDQILAIDGADTHPMALAESVNRMRGASGTTVQVRLQRVGAAKPEELAIVRQVVLLSSVLGDVRRSDGSWDYHLAEEPRIGYLRITTFGKHTAEEMRAVLARRPNGKSRYEALIIDLRGNAGGLLDAAVEVCDLFLDEGVIVSTSDREGRIQSSYSASPEETLVPAEVPVVVLVNGVSASASEIMASCLQDHRRAVVVGSRTWGKGTVQNVFELEGGRSALKLTTAGYVRPSGRNIHKRKEATDQDVWGVQPDKGFDVQLTDAEAAQLVEQRQKHDVAPLSSTAGSSGLASAARSKEVASKPLDDRQLRRAIDYVRQRIEASKG